MTKRSIETRLSELEKAQGPGDRISTIFRRIVTPGQLDSEVDHIHDYDGKHWTRQKGETENAFIERAERETQANAYGVKCLLGEPLVVSLATY